jgi:hypothetical protein
VINLELLNPQFGGCNSDQNSRFHSTQVVGPVHGEKDVHFRPSSRAGKSWEWQYWYDSRSETRRILY